MSFYVCRAVLEYSVEFVIEYSSTQLILAVVIGCHKKADTRFLIQTVGATVVLNES